VVYTALGWAETVMAGNLTGERSGVKIVENFVLSNRSLSYPLLSGPQSPFVPLPWFA
jgi:hypothetical protein